MHDRTYHRKARCVTTADSRDYASDSQDELLREARDAAEKDGDPLPESVSDVPENLVLGMAEFRGVHPTLCETLEYIEGEYTYHMVATELTATQRYYAADLQAESTDLE